MSTTMPVLELNVEPENDPETETFQSPDRNETPVLTCADCGFAHPRDGTWIRHDPRDPLWVYECPECDHVVAIASPERRP